MASLTINKILIANRGEIAVRILRTCRAMGIATVAVYSDADAHATHARLADEAFHIGSAASRESYLNIPKIIAAAERTGADAIHPGYGFLSENADFAAACAIANLKFIGPAPAVIRQMGLKTMARQLAAAAGVPVVPGYDGAEQDIETLRARALETGLPVLIKAAAGGGGKGLRVVRAAAEIDEAVSSARREAEAAFGDGQLLLEKFIARARHVEVQILGDEHGRLVHLFERDCSLQRRHQKIIEESPAPALDDELRARLGQAALKVGRHLGYTNAGTVEFLLAPSGEFYFIEVNTRLQVEHPVTELVTGLDLVKLQIEIAEGQPLPFAQDELKINGHAVEVRLYAEDPRQDFLPATGQLLAWEMPEALDGMRVDAGVETGMTIGIHYDPLLAKLIAHAADRATAIRKLTRALRHSHIAGLQTNRDFLLRLLEHAAFQQGEVHTNFIAEYGDELRRADDEQLQRASLIAVALYLQQQARAAGDWLSELPPSYRNNPYRPPAVNFQVESQEVIVSWQHLDEERYEVSVFDAAYQAAVLSCHPHRIRLALDGLQREFKVLATDQQFYVHSSLGQCIVKRLPRYPLPQAAAAQGATAAPMPGQVRQVLVAVGARVSAGAPLIILEAMKMEHTLRAATDGLVEAILCKPGEIVGPGQVLVQLSAAPCS